jgi:hypothetical protein
MAPTVELVGQAGAARPAQDRTHAQRQLTRAEGLGDVVVRAGLEADQAVGLVAEGGQHDHRDRPLGAQPAAHLEAVHAGQHEVEDDEVGWLLGHPAQRLVAVVHALDRVPVPHEVTPDNVRHGGIVVDNDNPPRRIGVAYQRIPVPRN